MTNAKILRDAADLIETPGVWVQGAYARRNPTGHACTTDNPDARCFCTAGAVYKLARAFNRGCYRAAPPLIALLDRLCRRDLDQWNDTEGRTAAECAALLREAAAVVDGQVEEETEVNANGNDPNGSITTVAESANDSDGVSSNGCAFETGVEASPAMQKNAPATVGADQGLRPDSQPGGLRDGEPRAAQAPLGACEMLHIDSDPRNPFPFLEGMR